LNDVRGACGFANSTANAVGMCSVYDTTRFRIAGVYQAAEGVMGSGFFALNGVGPITFNGTLTVPILGWKASNE